MNRKYAGKQYIPIETSKIPKSTTYWKNIYLGEDLKVKKTATNPLVTWEPTPNSHSAMKEFIKWYQDWSGEYDERSYSLSFAAHFVGYPYDNKDILGPALATRALWHWLVSKKP